MGKKGSASSVQNLFCFQAFIFNLLNNLSVKLNRDWREVIFVKHNWKATFAPPINELTQTHHNFIIS